MYKAEIIADSLNPQGNRLTTFVVTYPRIVHAEMCRHRMHSRNTASSRAIPFAKMVKDVQENPFIPIAWQKDHKGMQGTEYLTEKESEIAKLNWLHARTNAVSRSQRANTAFGVTKQLCNRLLEPFMWTTEIISGTEWENFFELRCPQYQTPVSQTIEPQRSWKDLLSNHSNPANEKLLKENKDNWVFKLQHNKSQADIHIQAIAELMWDAYNESTPKQLKAEKWHIPFGDNINITNKFAWDNSTEDLIEAKIKIATARCARVSYLNFEGKDDYEADIKLHDRLMSMKHWSPFEHCARVMSNGEYYSFTKSKPNGWCRNYRGFVQYRHLIEH